MEIGTYSTSNIKQDLIDRIRRLIKVLDPKNEWISIHNSEEWRMEMFIEPEIESITYMWFYKNDNGIEDLIDLDVKILESIVDMLEQILLETY